VDELRDTAGLSGSVFLYFCGRSNGSFLHGHENGVWSAAFNPDGSRADSDEVARAFRDDVAWCSDMMSPGGAHSR
jgi:hypothetical protein